MHLVEFTSVLPRLLNFPVPRLVDSALGWILGLREIGRLYAVLRSMGEDRPIAERLLQHLGTTYRVAEQDVARIPRKGPAVVVVNHPFGILEGAVLATVLSPIRGDVKFLANGVLTAIPEIRDLLISVDPMGHAAAKKGNWAAVRKSIEFLKKGGLLVIFPAGEVSHFQWEARAVVDPPWNPAVARLLSLAERQAPGLAVIPAYVAGANSTWFQLLGLLHPRVRTALLGRELLNKRHMFVDLRFGGSISAAKLLAIPSDQERTRYLRWRTYLLASRQQYKARTALPLPRRKRRLAAAITTPVDPARLSREVRALPPDAMLATSGDLCVFLAPSGQIPATLTEIGRLRELTFRAAGEGTGKACDLDEFDSHYLHLFVWNERKQEVVGAYRLVPADRVWSRFGPGGLYTATLFSYSDEFLRRMGPALELGRSFIRADYQRSFSPLLLLWKGIGRYVARNPQYKVLFGPVSISNQYQSISRELMVSFLEREASLREWIGLVTTRNPFRPRRPSQDLPGKALDLDDLSAVVSDLEPSRAGMPVLLRHYLKLGGKLLGFNVDPKFSDALDGLILVDLTKTEPRLLERYLGKAETAAFLAFHKQEELDATQ
jgi:putative hemolysin